MPEALHISPLKGKAGDVVSVTGLRTLHDDGTAMKVAQVCINCVLASDCKGCTTNFKVAEDGKSLTFIVPSPHKGRTKGPVAVKYAGHGDDYSFETFSYQGSFLPPPPPPPPSPVKKGTATIVRDAAGVDVAIFTSKGKLKAYLKANPSFTAHPLELNP